MRSIHAEEEAILAARSGLDGAGVSEEEAHA
jgi:hypothetical protein